MCWNLTTRLDEMPSILFQFVEYIFEKVKNRSWILIWILNSGMRRDFMLFAFYWGRGSMWIEQVVFIRTQMIIFLPSAFSANWRQMESNLDWNYNRNKILMFLDPPIGALIQISTSLSYIWGWLFFKRHSFWPISYSSWLSSYNPDFKRQAKRVFLFLTYSIHFLLHWCNISIPTDLKQLSSLGYFLLWNF